MPDSKPVSANSPRRSEGARRRSSAATIRDVAERSGFSSATVSIVLNNAPLARYIPDATKARIQRAASQLGYRPNLFARSLRGRRSHTVGVMVFDMTDPYCTLVLRGIETCLYEASFLPILTDVHNDRTRFERYLEMLLDRRIEGLVVLANWTYLDINVLADLEKSNIPTAIVSRELKNNKVGSVIVDNALGARAALEHLYSLGHRKIAFIRGPRSLVDTVPRWRGMRNAARDLELKIDPRLVVDLPESRDPFSSFEDGYNLTQQLLHRRVPLTAVVAFDDMTAFGAIRALSKAGMRVPEQCSVVGFDDIAAAALYTPALTTIRQPMEVMGATAATLVIEAINAVVENKPFHPMHRTLAPELIVRESTRALK
jgi:LacI family transcriptional regulator